MDGTFYYVSIKVQGEPTPRLDTEMDVMNVHRVTGSGGTVTWRGVVKIGLTTYSAIAYGDAPLRWLTIHMVDPRDMLLYEIEQKVALSFLLDRQPKAFLKSLNAIRLLFAKSRKE